MFYYEVLDEARARVTNLETEILSLKEYFAKEKQLPAQKALRNEEKPAFTVALSVDEDVTDDYIIVFDDVSVLSKKRKKIRSLLIKASKLCQ